MLKIATASFLIAGAIVMGAVSASEARSMRTVTCPNGQTIQVRDSQSTASACARTGKVSVAPSGGHQEAKGNPCAPGKSTKGCRDWINGTKKPPIRPKG